MTKVRHSAVLVENLAANLKTLRTLRGLSQVRLAADSKISVAYLSQLERRLRAAPLHTVERIANAAGVEPHSLLLPPPLAARAWTRG